MLSIVCNSNVQVYSGSRTRDDESVMSRVCVCVCARHPPVPAAHLPFQGSFSPSSIEPGYPAAGARHDIHTDSNMQVPARADGRAGKDVDSCSLQPSTSLWLCIVYGREIV
jgi:hypothetical protein